MTHVRFTGPAPSALLAAALALAAPFAAAVDRDRGKVIAGWVEDVLVRPWDIETKAKLDTGANTSSIHAVDIERFAQDGEDWVRFTLVLEDVEDEVHRVEVSREVVRRLSIKDHDATNERRVSVVLQMCLDGRQYPVEFSLADRGNFTYPVLLGRRFLAEVAVVDPASTFVLSARCEPLAVSPP